MTLLQEIVDEASSGSTPAASLLRKVKVLASRTATAPLGQWVEHELNGYPDDAPFPPYRGPTPAEAKGDFNVFGRILQNADIPRLAFPKDMRSGPMFTTQFRESISELQALADSSGQIAQFWPNDLVQYVNRMVSRGEASLYETNPPADAGVETTVAPVPSGRNRPGSVARPRHCLGF